MKVFLCETCGAPIDAPWSDLVITCTSCGSQNFPGRAGGPVAPRAPVDERPRLNLGGRTYVLERLLASGDSSDVFLARWVVRLGERVTIKIDAAGDGDLLRAEHSVLSKLAKSRVQGAEHFLTRLPAPVALGMTAEEAPRVASVYGWRSGFVHTLEQVGEHHRRGVKGQAVVWLLKRLLELLGFVHASGFAHGAVTPAHVLVHPRDHGAMLVGWTVAGRIGTPRRGFPEAWSPLRGGRLLSIEDDIRMACRCVRGVAGWHLKDAVAVAPIKRILDQGEAGCGDAWELADALTAASRQAFGPPGYHPLYMPGWS